MAILMKRLVMVGLLAIAIGAVTTSSSLAGEDSPRKPTRKVAPVYPEIARKMRLAGTVRLAALVAPDGQVKSAETIGGHPVLVAAATNAVMQWKYQAAARESREIAVFEFTPE